MSSLPKMLALWEYCTCAVSVSRTRVAANSNLHMILTLAITDSELIAT